MKKLWLALILSPVFCFAQKEKPAKTYDLLIGTYIPAQMAVRALSLPVYLETGKTAYLSEIDGISNPPGREQ